MSKMDDMRALREARYEAARAGAAKTAGTKPTGTKPAAAPRTPRQAPAKAEKTEAAPAAGQEGLCGHRAISGRTCTREKGHAAKSHRYS